MWNDLVASLSGKSPQSNPEPLADVVALEQALGLAMPSELRSFLVEHGPLKGGHGEELVWSTSGIQARNRELRTNAALGELYMPFSHLLLFGDHGDGDLFAYPIQADGVVHNLDVFVWEHETDARSWFASGFRSFLSATLAEVA